MFVFRAVGLTCGKRMKDQDEWIKLSNFGARSLWVLGLGFNASGRG